MDDLTRNTLQSVKNTLIYLLILYGSYFFVVKKGFISIILWIFLSILFKDMWAVIVENGKKYITSLITITILFSMIYYLGKLGVVGFILIIVILSAYKLIVGRKELMAAIRNIETKLFGKPLDKENWEKEEDDSTAKL